MVYFLIMAFTFIEKVQYYHYLIRKKYYYSLSFNFIYHLFSKVIDYQLVFIKF